MKEQLIQMIQQYYKGFLPIKLEEAILRDVVEVQYSELRIKFNVVNDYFPTPIEKRYTIRLHDYPALLNKVLNDIVPIIEEHFLEYIGDTTKTITLHPDIDKIYIVDTNYHKSGKNAIITFTNRFNGNKIINYYSFSSSKDFWIFSANSNLKAFKEMRGEFTNSFDDIIYEFDKSVISPKIESYTNILQLPVDTFGTNHFKCVEVIGQTDDTMQFIVRSGTAAGLVSEIMYDAKITKAKTGINLTSRQCKSEFANIVKTPMDYEQNPYNIAVHHLFKGAQPKYKTDYLWVTFQNRVYARPINCDSGTWVFVADDLRHHISSFISPESISELQMWDIISQLA